jgi:hypothetical protein
MIRRVDWADAAITDLFAIPDPDTAAATRACAPLTLTFLGLFVLSVFLVVISLLLSVARPTR